MLKIFIDGDGCPVKEETYKVSERYQVHVVVVANKWMNVPLNPLIEMQVVDRGFDAADDWIVETLNRNDVVITADVLLADRCVRKGARVLGPKGEEFTEDNVGSAVATRELMQHLRALGEARGGPAPMNKTDRSRYLGKLDQIVQWAKRASGCR